MPTLDFDFGQRRKLTRDEFDANDYLSANDDVKSAGADPWSHYENFGANDAHRPWGSADMQRYNTRSQTSQPQQGQPAPTAPTAPSASAPPPPPPPPPPPVAPPPMVNGIPQPQAIAAPPAAPDFMRLAQMSPAQRQQGYNPSVTMGAAPDFMGLSRLPEAQRGQGYTQSHGPGAAPDFLAMLNGLSPVGDAPDFQGITGALGDAQAGPAYSTAEGGWQGEELSGDLNAMARRAMANPSRVDAPLVQQTLDLINQDLDRNRTQASRRVREEMGARGVAGPESSPWAGSLSEMETDLGRIEAQRKNDLARWVADTHAADNQAAANIGLGVGAFGRSLGADRRGEGQFAWNADRTTGRDLEGDKLNRVNANLQGAGMTEDATRFRTDADFRKAGLGLDAASRAEGAQMDRARFGQAENQFGANFGRMIGRDFEDDLSRRAGLALQGAGMGEDANRFRAGFQEDQNRAAYDTARTAARDFEDDNRARTGVTLQGAGMAEGAGMNRANFGMSANNQLFNQSMAGAQFGEGRRQFDMGFGLEERRFGEDTRRYDQGFGEDVRRYDQGFGEDRRRFDADFGLRDLLGRGALDLDRDRFGESRRQFNMGFGENQRQFNAGYGLDRDRFGESQRQFDTGTTLERERNAHNIALTREGHGLQREQMAQQGSQFAQQLGLDFSRLSQQDKQFFADLEEKSRHYKQLEDLALMDYYERTQSWRPLEDGSEANVRDQNKKPSGPPKDAGKGTKWIWSESDGRWVWM